ncbi:MAG TPA: B12-binding domain-containing radical SAM protein [Nitrospinaceae bacterium]|nr:B12-binding domain-containing radical SAM protein [Nitrospinaceae bacterium]
MKIIFPVMGAENISVAVMATLCKDLGHSVKVAFDRALFDDKQYFSIDFLANLFDKKKQVIEEIIKEKPDVLALSVFSDNYQWSLDLVRRVKEKHKNFVTVWGGIHPTSVPAEVIKEDAVDFVIEGDGELPMTKLLHALENGKVFEDVPNLWFKRDGEIFPGKHTYLNEEGSFPIPDKNVFENFIPMEEYYLTVTNKGCIQKCSFCSENFKFDHEAELREGSFIREKSVDTVIQELKGMKEKYKLRYIDIKNNVLSGSKKWISEFCEKYPKEVGLPFRVMVQPLQLQKDYASMLKKAGCHHVQMGIESFNAKVRKEVLLRDETTEQVITALEKLDEAGINFSADLILGLPGEKEEDLIYALKTLSPRKHLIRASIFWLQYAPNVDITKQALDKGFIGKDEEKMINEGLQDNYLSTGSPMEGERKRILKTYHILYRLIPIVPHKLMVWMLDTGVYKIFRHIPFQIALIIAIDVFVSYYRKDYYAKWIMKWYVKQLWKNLTGQTKYISN